MSEIFSDTEIRVYVCKFSNQRKTKLSEAEGPKKDSGMYVDLQIKSE